MRSEGSINVLVCLASQGQHHQYFNLLNSLIKSRDFRILLYKLTVKKFQ